MLVKRDPVEDCVNDRSAALPVRLPVDSIVPKLSMKTVVGAVVSFRVGSPVEVRTPPPRANDHLVGSTKGFLSGRGRVRGNGDIRRQTGEGTEARRQNQKGDDAGR